MSRFYDHPMIFRKSGPWIVWSLLKFAVCRTLCGHHSKVVAYLNLTAYSKIITVDLVCLWWHITLSSLIVRSHSHRATVSSLEQERFQGTLESWRGTHHSSSVGSWFHAWGGNRKHPLDEFQTDSRRVFVLLYRVTTFLAFLEMSGYLAKVREKSGKRPKIRGRSGNLCSQGNLIVVSEQNCLPVVYFIHTVIHFSYVMFTENLD